MAKLGAMALVTTAADDVRLFAYDPSETNPINRSKGITVGQIRNILNYPVQAGETGVVSTDYPVGNVKRYGAIGNNVHDDTAAFQLAVAAVVTLNTMLVTVPEGTYKITGIVTLQSGVKVIGLGFNQSRLVCTLPGSVAFYGSGIVDCSIEYLDISGLLSFGVLFNVSSRVSVIGCEISGCTSDTHVTGYSGGIHAWLCDDLKIEDNYFHDNGNLTVGKLSSDIQVNGNGFNTGNLRAIIRGNRCLSVLVQTNIAAYDIQRSEICNNIVSGAKTGAGDNNGYGIVCYRSPNNSGFMRDIRINNNLVYGVGGSGIYIQSCDHVTADGNAVYDAGVVQNDITLTVGGISINNSTDVTVSGNVVVDCGKSSIVVGGPLGLIDGHTITGNVCNSTIAGAYAILIRGPAYRLSIVDNTIKGHSRSIGTTPVTQGIVAAVITGNVCTGAFARAIDIYGISESIIKDNTIIASGGDGIALVVGSRNIVGGNNVHDGSTLATNTHIAIDLSSITDSLIEGNLVGNTGGVGYKWGIYLPANCLNNSVRGNHAKGCLTQNYNVDTTAAAGNTFHSNYDSASPFPQHWGARQQMVLMGAPASVTQFLLGDSSVYSALGTRFSGGDTFITNNASHSLTADSWHQSNAANASKLVILRSNGDFEFYSTALGTADGNFATFWGTAKAALGAGSTLKFAGTQVLGARITGYAAMTGAPNKATVYDTATVTLVQLAGRVAQLQADLTTHGAIGP